MKRILSVLLAVVMLAALFIATAGNMAVASAPNLDSASAWAREGITAAVDKGFVPADIQGRYNSVITRQEFCRMAVKWVEYATEKSIDAVLTEKGLSRDANAFSDTSDPDILAAFALCITSGVGGGRFAPEGRFSREQAATMIMNTCRAIGANMGSPPASGFNDMGAASGWAVRGINYVRANGIMQGTGTNPPIFSPKLDYTREQSIVTFNNIDLDSIEIIKAGKIISVSAGNGHSIALDDKGQLWAWGDNYYGQIGDGNFTTYLDPVYDYASPDDEYAEIVEACTKNVDNDVYFPKFIMSGVKAAFAREDSSFAITNEGKLYAWGRNDIGQLCDGATTNKALPTFIMDDVLDVDSDRARTIILKTNGTLWIAGTLFGFITDEETSQFKRYQELTLFYEGVKKAVLEGATQSRGVLILTSDNRVINYTHDSNSYPLEYSFVEIASLKGSVDISAASQQVYAQNANGAVYGWGANTSEGYLGANSDVFWINEPVQISSNISKLLRGRMFIGNDGTLLAWGTVNEMTDYRNSSGTDGGGALGPTLIEYGIAPKAVLQNVNMAVGSSWHFVALDNNGFVNTWGMNFYGQLGDGGSANRATPKRIAFP